MVCYNPNIVRQALRAEGYFHDEISGALDAHRRGRCLGDCVAWCAGWIAAQSDTPTVLDDPAFVAYLDRLEAEQVEVE